MSMPDETIRSHRRVVLTFAVWIAWAWTVMTVTHEMGHVLAGIVGGGKLSVLELRPWHLPHSLFAHDRFPLLTLWSGPALGCLLPLGAAAVVRRPSVWFVAWFCLLANASYLLLGYWSGDAELDSTKLINHGAHPTHLFFAVGLTLPLGYFRFRQCCIRLFSGHTPAMSRAQLQGSTAAWIVVLAIQALLGSW